MAKKAAAEKAETKPKKFKFNPESRATEHDQHHAHIEQQEQLRERERIDSLQAEAEEEV